MLSFSLGRYHPAFLNAPLSPAAYDYLSANTLLCSFGDFFPTFHFRLPLINDAALMFTTSTQRLKMSPWIGNYDRPTASHFLLDGWLLYRRGFGEFTPVSNYTICCFSLFVLTLEFAKSDERKCSEASLVSPDVI